MQDIPLPDGMPPRVVTERWFAKVYGFKDWETRELSLESLVWWPILEDAEAKAHEMRQKMESQVQKAKGHW